MKPIFLPPGTPPNELRLTPRETALYAIKSIEHVEGSICYIGGSHPLYPAWCSVYDRIRDAGAPDGSVAVTANQVIAETRRLLADHPTAADLAECVAMEQKL